MFRILCFEIMIIIVYKNSIINLLEVQGKLQSFEVKGDPDVNPFQPENGTRSQPEGFYSF